MLIELIEIFQRGFNRVVLLDPAQCCHESFVTITGDANDNRFIPRNSSFLDELPGYRDFHSSRRDQWSVARVQSNLRLSVDRQQLAVAPKILSPAAIFSPLIFLPIAA